MKAWKIIGIIVLVLVVAGGIAYGAYAFGKSQSSSETTNDDTSNNKDNKSSSNSNNVQPKVVTDTTCNADELSLSVGEGNGPGAGNVSVSLVFTNSSQRECTLYGYPGVSLVNVNGNQVGSPADRTTGATSNTVTLKPGQSASAPLTYAEEGDFDAGTCKDGATKLRVYPPNDFGYISIATTISSWCPGFQVGPVAAS